MGTHSNTPFADNSRNVQVEDKDQQFAGDVPGRRSDPSPSTLEPHAHHESRSKSYGNCPIYPPVLAHASHRSQVRTAHLPQLPGPLTGRRCLRRSENIRSLRAGKPGGTCQSLERNTVHTSGTTSATAESGIEVVPKKQASQPLAISRRNSSRNSSSATHSLSEADAHNCCGTSCHSFSRHLKPISSARRRRSSTTARVPTSPGYSTCGVSHRPHHHIGRRRRAVPTFELHRQQRHPNSAPRTHLRRRARPPACCPRMHLHKEVARELTFTPEQEVMLLAKAPQPLADFFVILMDTGARPEEVCRIRWENVLWTENMLKITDGKTNAAKRDIGMSTRVVEILTRRVREQSTSKHFKDTPWVFPSRVRRNTVKHIVSVNKAFAIARRAAGLPRELVLYSARHTFGTESMAASKDLKLTIRTMGQVDVKTAMRYQHPETGQVSDIMNARNAQRKSATIGQDGHTFGHSDLSMQ
jgi:integrase